MAELIRRVGHILVGLHLRLILVIPEPSDTAIFSVFVTKPNRFQYIKYKINDASPAL